MARAARNTHPQSPPASTYSSVMADQSSTIDNSQGSSDRYAPHLSEFYSMVNEPRKKKNASGPSSQGASENVLESPIRSTANSSIFRIRRPSSLRSGFSSMTDLQPLVTSRDMTQTVDTMQQLLANVESYAQELVATSQRASMLALSLEQMARLKGCNDETADKFLSSSGLFHLIANHQRIMSDCMTSSMVETLANRIDEFQFKRRVREARFKKEFYDEAKKLKLQEKYNLQFSKRKTRNLLSYRENLANLQLQLDELESLKHRYYQDSSEMVEGCCNDVLRDMATVSRAQVEISENIARKGWSGGGLDDLMIDADDPFSKEGQNDDVDAEGESNMLNSPFSHVNSRTATPRAEPLTSTPTRGEEDAGSATSVPSAQSSTQETCENSFSLPGPQVRHSESKQENENTDTEDTDAPGIGKKLLDGLQDFKLENGSTPSLVG
ncbi:Protein IVY1 [Lachancea thermotolerans]